MNKTNYYWVFLTMVLFLLTGCDLVPLHMRDQPRYDTYERSTLFENGTSARSIPANTVPRGKWAEIKLNEALYTGQVEGEYVEEFPIPVDREMILHGQEQYNIFCSPCHSRVGDGQGMIVQRGFPQPPSFHIERLQEAPVGYYYEVITEGFGVMYSYADRVQPEDRWAIVAYIRALQYSQNISLESLPEGERQEIEAQLEEEDNESN
jgi:hypothetical protein